MILLGSIERTEILSLLQRHFSRERRLKEDRERKGHEEPFTGQAPGIEGAPATNHMSFLFIDEEEGDGYEMDNLERSRAETPKPPTGEQPKRPTTDRKAESKGRS
ncbi:chloride channel protein 1-like [Heptranchias perlo]|uniref:chloride channel protein 1-like n=1 Tax=Heptranchias perlo TaxID=212740 RepID=UPI003559AE3A